MLNRETAVSLAANPGQALLTLLVICVSALYPDSVLATPTPLVPGWTVRQIPGFFFGISFSNGLTYDPNADTLLVSDNIEPGATSVNRITLDGQVSTFYSQNLPEALGSLDINSVTGRVYVGYGIEKVTGLKILDSTGSLVHAYLPPMFEDYIGDFVLDSTGELYVSLGYQDALARYNEIDQSYSIVATQPGLGGRLTVDEHDNFYMAGLQSVFKVTPNGVVSELPGYLGLTITYGDGYLFGTSGTSTIQRIASDGTGFTAFATGHGNANEPHFASNGRLYVVDNSTIWEYSYVPEPVGIAVLATAFSFRRYSASGRKSCPRYVPTQVMDHPPVASGPFNAVS